MLVEKICEEPRRRVLEPSEVVKELNNRFFLKDDANPYFTIAYGVLEPGTGMVHLVRAGHPFPLLQKAGGAVHVVNPEGHAVGLFPNADPASEEIRLEKGDRLFLYSDGLVDCTSPSGARFGAPRFTDLVRAEKGKPLAEVMASVRRELVAWRGSETFADDVSLLVLEKE
jgi:sigma-B regulation protein RsbU (phosphoserine phosphatase)